LSVPGEDRRLSWPGWLTAYCRVPTPPESQGIVFAKFPGPGKLWKMSVSWKSKCMVTESPEFARQLCENMYVRTHLFHVVHPQKCSSGFFAISSQHVTAMNIYCSVDAAMCG